MGYVPSYCQLSGCAPSAPHDLPFHWRVQNALDTIKDDVEGTRLREALEQLAAEEKPRMEVTVIGPIKDGGDSVYPEEEDFQSDPDNIENKHADSLRVVPHCVGAGSWEFGFVTAETSEKDYLVSYGPCIFVLSAALPILYLATNGRITLKQLWRLAMRQGRNDGDANYILERVQYGGIEESIEQFLVPLPGLNRISRNDLGKLVEGWLQRTSSVEELKKLLTLEQKWWMWMAPDNFPLEPSPLPSPPPILTAPPPDIDLLSPSSSPPPLASLPFDILVTISSLLPLPSLLALTSTSRTLRFSLLSSPTKRDCLASAWLNTSGRCWIPRAVDLGVDLASGKAVEEKDVTVKKIELLELEEEDGWWGYLRRCAAESGSMRNRKRVWETALSIEAAVERQGLL